MAVTDHTSPGVFCRTQALAVVDHGCIAALIRTDRWAAGGGTMAVDIFLQLDGIKGEAQDDKYKDEIDVLAWSWGASQSGTTHGGSGSGGGKVSVQDLSITKYIDKS